MLTIRKTSFALMLCSLGLLAACDSAVDDVPYCGGRDGEICEPAGFPFVTSAFILDDCTTNPGCTATATTATLTQPQPGTLCMKGNVPTADGYAWLGLGVSRWNKGGNHIIEAFNAWERGITGLAFTVDHPPPAGVTMFATSVKQTFCSIPSECLYGWNLTTGSRADVIKSFTMTGPVTAPFSSFQRNPNDVFNTDALAHFMFVVGPGVYDYCVSDLRFVNASGDPVNP